MEFQRKDPRLDIKLSSSIKGIYDERRNFCIIRNISRNGVFLTAKVKFDVGQDVECIISFDEQSIMFRGVIRRTIDVQENDALGYGIEITEISEENNRILDEFVTAGYLPEVE